MANVLSLTTLLTNIADVLRFITQPMCAANEGEFRRLAGYFVQHIYPQNVIVHANNIEDFINGIIGLYQQFNVPFTPRMLSMFIPYMVRHELITMNNNVAPTFHQLAAAWNNFATNGLDVNGVCGFGAMRLILTPIGQTFQNHSFLPIGVANQLIVANGLATNKAGILQLILPQFAFNDILRWLHIMQQACRRPLKWILVAAADAPLVTELCNFAF